MKTVFKKTLLAIAIIGLSSSVTYAQSRRTSSRNNHNSNRTRINNNAVRSHNRTIVHNHSNNRVSSRNNRYVHRSVRVNTLPRASRYVSYNNVRYSHHNGVFYRSSGSAFVTVLPPVGLRLSILPVGFSRRAVNSRNYYYCSGAYYRDFNGGGYEVVQDPYNTNYTNTTVGLDVLPNNYQVVESNGQVLFLANGQYYQAISQGNGNVVYQAVEAPYGTILDTLPLGHEVVEFDGNVYFKVGNTYYKAISEANGNVVYQVVHVF